MPTILKSAVAVLAAAWLGVAVMGSVDMRDEARIFSAVDHAVRTTLSLAEHPLHHRHAAGACAPGEAGWAAVCDVA
jgi:hypothetical protein